MQTSTYFSALICLFISIKFLTLHFINRELIANFHLMAFNDAFIDNEASRIGYLALYISS
jgi:hypothetical protein